MDNKTNNLYEFGEFQIDTNERVLLRGNETIVLAAKVFDTLEILVEHQGKIVSKDDLMNRVWADSFVEESNLSQNIYVLRKTLGKEFIETVPRRGYRFTVPVKVVEIIQKSSVNSSSEADLIVATKTKTHILEEIETDFKNADKNLALPEKQLSNWFGSKTLFASVLVAISIFALGFIGYKYSQNEEEKDSSPIIRNNRANLEFEKLTHTGNSFSPTISPDGKFVAYLKRDSSGQTLQLLDTSSRNDVELNIENDVKPSLLEFSPDGNRLFFITGTWYEKPREIYEVSYFGGQPKLVAENVYGSFSISPDGKKLAYYRIDSLASKESLIIRDLADGKEKELSTKILPEELYISVRPAWTRDGSKIAVVPLKEKSNRSEMIFLDIESGEEKTIKTDLTYIRQLAFLPDDENMLIVSRKRGFQIFKHSLSTGKSIRLTNDLSNYRSLSLTTDGKKILTQTRKLHSDIWLFPDADIEKGRKLSEGGFFGLYDLSYLKSGVVAFDRPGKTNRELVFVDPETNRQQILSKDENTNNNHKPKSDSEGLIYFVSDQGGSINVWRINPDGTNAMQITFGEKGELNLAPEISSDDKWLYFIKKTDKSSSIWRKSLTESSKPELVYEAKGFSIGRFLRLSPDEKWLAFNYLKGNAENGAPTANSSKKPKFAFLNLEDKKKLRIFETQASRPMIRWSTGGKSFDYYQAARNNGKIWRQDLENKDAPPKLVFETPETRIMHFDWSPDGKDLVTTRANIVSDVVLIHAIDF